MKTLFVDTSAFIALIDKDDQYHGTAKEFYQKLRPPFKFTTTNFVVCETINFLRCQTSSEICRRIQGRHPFKQANIHITPEFEDSAFDLLKAHKDKTYSFTDCTSFAVMKELGIFTAFTFDDHFRQIGFTVVP